MDNKKLVNLLSTFAVFLMIPLVFSAFFDGYSVVSKGVQTNAPIRISIFEYLNQRSVILAFSFVFALVLVLTILVGIVYSIKLSVSGGKGGILRFYTSIITIISAILTFVFTLSYCTSHSGSSGSASLTYKVGGCMILMLVCGVVIGTLNLVCYFLENKKNKSQK